MPISNLFRPLQVWIHSIEQIHVPQNVFLVSIITSAFLRQFLADRCNSSANACYSVLFVCL